MRHDCNQHEVSPMAGRAHGEGRLGLAREMLAVIGEVILAEGVV